MWLYRQIKKHPSLAMGITLLLGGAAFPILYLIAAAWTVYAITAVICLVVGPSLGGCLGWLVDRGDRNQGSLSVSPLPPTSTPPIPRVVAPAQDSSNLELKQETTREKVKEEKRVVVGKKTEAEDLPDVLKGIIIDYVGGDFGDSKAIFSPAYFAAYCSFFMTTNGRKYNRAEAIVFLQYIVKGEEEKAKGMLQDNSALLFCTEVVTDYSGRRIKGTAYQIALGAEDIEMARMIQPHFRIAYGNDEEKAQAEIKRQYDAQFTLESKAIEEKNAAADREALNKVIQAIREATPEDCRLLLEREESKKGKAKGIAAELKQFRTYLDSKTEGVITSGKHFNAHLLVEAFNQYDANYVTFGNWDAPKNNLFWRQVIGYIQRYLPTCYAQAFCQGINYIVNGGESLTRSLHFRFSSAYSFFPLSAGESGLGYEYAGVAGSQRCGWPHTGFFSYSQPFAAVFNLYVQQKQRDGELMQHPYEHQPTTNISCALM